MPELLTPISSLQLRQELQQIVAQDLLGPAGGVYEEIEERNVRGRYLLGLLAPKGQAFVPDEQNDAAAGSSGDAQDGKSDTVAPQMASMPLLHRPDLYSGWVGPGDWADILISMDGRGQAMDDLFIQWFWRTLKYEDIYLKEYADVPSLFTGLTRYMQFYNHERRHQSLKDCTRLKCTLAAKTVV